MAKTCISQIITDGKVFNQYIDLSTDEVVIEDRETGVPLLLFNSSGEVFKCGTNGEHNRLGRIRTSDFYEWKFIYDASALDELPIVSPPCKIEIAALFYIQCIDYTIFEQTLFQFLYDNHFKK